jgi:NTP pyrophosphatase (non-canonical NTP hydrolase)
MHILSNPIYFRSLQDYVREFERERGFDQQSAIDKCLLLGEEIGELFRAIRLQEGMKSDPDSQGALVGEELADVVIYLAALANRFNIDLEHEVVQKAIRNSAREWR